MATTFAVSGVYNGDAATILCDGGKLSGVPLTAVAEVALERDRLAATGETVAATPTGPFYQPRSPEALLLTILSVIETPEIVGDAPEIPTQPDELEYPASGTSAKAATVRVRPYEREGHPVVGYIRHGKPTVSTHIVKTMAEAAEIRADLITDRSLRDAMASIPEIHALPVRRLEGQRWKVEGDGAKATWYGGGVMVDKLDYGDGNIRYSITSHVLPYPEGRASVSEDELEGALRQMIIAAREEAIKGWRKNYRGKIAGRSGEWLASHRRLDEAVAANDANAKYRRLREWAQIPDYVIAITEAAYNTPAFDNKDVLTTAFRGEGGANILPMTHWNMLATKTLIDIRQRAADRGYEDTITARKLQPGEAHASYAGDQDAGVLRHEWAHSLYDSFTDEQREEFAKLVPFDDPERLGKELSQYAASYTEQTPQQRKRFIEDYGEHGYLTETFSEAVTVVTHPDFKRDEWAPWVGKVADWLDRLTEGPRPR